MENQNNTEASVNTQPSAESKKVSEPQKKQAAKTPAKKGSATASKKPAEPATPVVSTPVEPTAPVEPVTPMETLTPAEVAMPAENQMAKIKAKIDAVISNAKALVAERSIHREKCDPYFKLYPELEELWVVGDQVFPKEDDANHCVRQHGGEAVHVTK